MEIMNYINDQKLDIKVIVISGHDDFQYVRAMFILGALEYLLKPIEQDKLLEAVKKAVSQIHTKEEQEEFAVDKKLSLIHIYNRYNLYLLLLHSQQKTPCAARTFADF